jgi:microcystin-dependent protein
MPWYLWSKTPSSNASADPTINWAEGQAPSSINDSARAMMARLAEFRDDCNGAAVVGGTATAYTLSSNQGFDTTAHMNNAVVAFTASPTNGAGVTLNVDGLGAFPLMLAVGTPVPAGSLLNGTIYVATFINAASIWKLQNFYQNPYNIPLGAGMDFWGATVPNSNFAFPIGQAISRTTYASLFALIGTAYGAGDGSTTFNLPDKTGRVSAMQEASASRLTSGYFGGNSTLLGATGGTESHTLITAEIPSHLHAVFAGTETHTHAITGGVNGGSSSAAASPTAGASFPNPTTAITIAAAATGLTVRDTAGGGGTANQTAQTGGGNAHAIVQPTIVCNYILRII